MEVPQHACPICGCLYYGKHWAMRCEAECTKNPDTARKRKEFFDGEYPSGCNPAGESHQDYISTPIVNGDPD